ncbi:hypothetical protein UCRNP2_696 [Neofusicoccum parvum UCRNP2]|uniref:Copper acquisition factor BIM1-like domain-containing protein n=1 Tax=Botryosphaeria parva (strain UCR-NP2) TaxID=1287680 RepID=R1GVZ3_BOTPV|nr:hypothetical protein UCRNP2_696 [Neofusicoccum parvum UCRNP2]
MLHKLLLTILSLLSLTTAHFRIEYPNWRGDSFEGTASQWIYPCANVNTTAAANRTLWPPTGGSLRLHVSHTWALTYVNVGLAEPNGTVASFNASLLAAHNQTGNGTFCLPAVGQAALEELAREAGVEGGVEGLAGRDATVQVVQIGHGGSALYNGEGGVYG